MSGGDGLLSLFPWWFCSSPSLPAHPCFNCTWFSLFSVAILFHLSSNSSPPSEDGVFLLVMDKYYKGKQKFFTAGKHSSVFINTIKGILIFSSDNSNVCWIVENLIFSFDIKIKIIKNPVENMFKTKVMLLKTCKTHSK